MSSFVKVYDESKDSTLPMKRKIEEISDEPVDTKSKKPKLGTFSTSITLKMLFREYVQNMKIFFIVFCVQTLLNSSEIMFNVTV